jgi:DGQHR domain-containing protein
MSNNIEVDAWKITHSGTDFYVFVLNSSILLKISYASENEKEQGAQRPLDPKRTSKVAQFIDSIDGILPNNVILNLSKESKFESSSKNSNFGKIIIPDVENSCWIVDGQHRIYGFEKSSKKFDLICSGFIGLSVEKQAQIFKTINQEQKGINPSVLYDLLPLTKDADYGKIRSQRLVELLNQDPESPWFNEVKMLGVGKGLVSQAAFARCLEKLIDPKGGVLTPYDEGLQYKILLNHFNAFKAIFNEAWGNNKYVLTKAIGLSLMCGIFPNIHSLCETNSNGEKDFTVENIIRQINELRDFDFSSSSRGQGTNKVAIQNLILEFQNKLPKISIKNQAIKV